MAEINSRSVCTRWSSKITGASRRPSRAACEAPCRAACEAPYRAACAAHSFHTSQHTSTFKNEDVKSYPPVSFSLYGFRARETGLPGCSTLYGSRRACFAPRGLAVLVSHVVSSRASEHAQPRGGTRRSGGAKAPRIGHVPMPLPPIMSRQSVMPGALEPAARMCRAGSVVWVGSFRILDVSA